MPSPSPVTGSQRALRPCGVPSPRRGNLGRRPCSPPAPRPCASCPYRRDVPSGVWSRGDYVKLPLYDGPTWTQPAVGAVPVSLARGW
ncbi:DUF6283 family protein [Streptomyces zaomyceticus]|uniref:DUF6283 family protein n=1 Tax=Streptomyces zaomyceticus TaxID=68286 RepID=UPI00364B44E8